MRFMIIIKADQNSEAGVLPSAGLLTGVGRFNDELVRAGVLLAGEGLHPSSRGARVRFSSGQHTVIEGPFAGSSDLIAGFWLLQVKSRAEAIEWVKRMPHPTEGDTEVEIRQVYDAEDFGAELTAAAPEVFEAERGFREVEEAQAQERRRAALQQA